MGGLRVMSESYNHLLMVFIHSTENIVFGHLYTLDGTHIAELSWINIVGNTIQVTFYEHLPSMIFQLIEVLPSNSFSFTDSI